MSRGHRIVLTLPPDEFDRLERLGAEQERDPWQQARWLLRRALLDAESAPGDEERPTSEVA